MQNFVRQRARWMAAPVLFAVAVCGLRARAQEGFGPIDPSQPTGTTPDQIVKRMGEQEAKFAQAREDYTFRQTVRMQTISEDTGKPDGEYMQVTDVGFNRDGSRSENVVFAPQNTLERVIIDQSDFDDLRLRLPLVLTTSDLPNYDVKYVGKQRIDEIDTYVFDASPKMMQKGQRYFEGRVWVDQKDLEIVMINGKNVPDDSAHGHFSLPFTTYYEQIDNENWFPTYTKAEGTVHFDPKKNFGPDVHMRSTVKYTDYRRFRTRSRIIYNGQDITNNKPPDATAPGGKPTDASPSKPH